MRGSKLRRPARYYLLLLAAGILAGCARGHRVSGLVLSVDDTRRSMLVSHREIPGVMPAMVMPFEVREAAVWNDLRPGAQVDFELKTRGGRALARRLRVSRPATSIEDGGDLIRIEPPAEALAIGSEVPRLEFVDQTGTPFTLDSLHGSVAAVNFIYTRCPLAEVCPRLSANFANIRRRFAARPDLVLVSITLDPVYDRPPVLAEYAGRVRARPELWRFLTGSEDQIRRAARLFGLVYWAEEGSVVHTSRTVVIGRGGRLAAMIEGSNYGARQLGDLLERELEKNK